MDCSDCWQVRRLCKRWVPRVINEGLSGTTVNNEHSLTIHTIGCI